MPDKKIITRRRKNYKGSRLRCLKLTNLPRADVSNFLNERVSGLATINENDFWMPEGFIKPGKAKLGESSKFLNEKHREELTNWWLEVIRYANTPNWDIVSTCKINGDTGLLLVVAKTIERELYRYGKGKPETDDGYKNDERIKQAIEETNKGLNEDSQLTGWHLSGDSHYQLSNRFAWAWKTANLGVPVILMYLGFLNASEMADSGEKIFTSSKQWEDFIINYAEGIVPTTAWEKPIQTKGASLTVIIRSAEVNISD